MHILPLSFTRLRNREYFTCAIASLGREGIWYNSAHEKEEMGERLKRVFLVRDCSANWFEHVPGCLEDGAGRFYAKHLGWFATDLEGMIDWCVADRIDALAVEGFLSDRHGLYRLAWADVRRTRD